MAGGADRWLRFWDVRTSVLLHEHFTGHVAGESVVSLAVSPDNLHIVTADSAGFVLVWDAAALAPLAAQAPVAQQARVASAECALARLAAWRAHQQPITQLAWVPAPPGAAAVALLLSSSLDQRLLLWGIDGAAVGTFGANSWQLADCATWRSSTPTPLTVRLGGGGSLTNMRCSAGREMLESDDCHFDGLMTSALWVGTTGVVNAYSVDNMATPARRRRSSSSYRRAACRPRPCNSSSRNPGRNSTSSRQAWPWCARQA